MAEFSMNNVNNTGSNFSNDLSSSRGFSSGVSSAASADQATTDWDSSAGIGGVTDTSNVWDTGADSSKNIAQSADVESIETDEGLTRGQQEAIFGAIETSGGIATSLIGDTLESDYNDAQREKMKNFTASNRAFQKNIERLQSSIRDSYRVLEDRKYNLKIKKQEAVQFGQKILELKKYMKSQQEARSQLADTMFSKNNRQKGYASSTRERWV